MAFWLALRVAMFSFFSTRGDAGGQAPSNGWQVASHAAAQFSGFGRELGAYCEQAFHRLRAQRRRFGIPGGVHVGGISNGAALQPMYSRTAATSLSPSAAPCTLSPPCRLGEPLPMTVLQQIRVGLSAFLAAAMAAETAATSWPSTARITFQP
jgi:hypothetical protein